MSIKEMSMDELDEVSGGLGSVAIGAVVGGLWGAFSYGTSGAGQSLGGYAVAIGSGVVGGAIAGMGGFGLSFYGGGLAAVGGVAATQMKEVKKKSK